MSTTDVTEWGLELELVEQWRLDTLARAGYDVFDPRLAERPGLLSARLAWHAMIRRY